MTSQLLFTAEDEPVALGPLRLLAAGRLGELAARDPQSYRAYLPSSAVADLAAGVAATPEALNQLRFIRRLDVTERLCWPWASDLEAVASLLWPAWERTGVPEDEDVARLGRVWAMCQPERLRGRLGMQVLEHIRRGVELPHPLWHAALDVHGAIPDVLERAPVEVLFEWTERYKHQMPVVLWRRAPARTFDVVAALLQTRAEVGHWLRVAPAERTEEILTLLPSVGATAPSVLEWSDRVIAERAPGWREVWRWRMEMH